MRSTSGACRRRSQREVVKFTTPSLKEQVTGCDSAQTEVAGNEKHDDDETDQPDDLIHGFSP